jgi:hypothetical protein
VPLKKQLVRHNRHECVGQLVGFVLEENLLRILWLLLELISLDAFPELLVQEITQELVKQLNIMVGAGGCLRYGTSPTAGGRS